MLVGEAPLFMDLRPAQERPLEPGSVPAASTRVTGGAFDHQAPSAQAAGVSRRRAVAQVPPFPPHRACGL